MFFKSERSGKKTNRKSAQKRKKDLKLQEKEYKERLKKLKKSTEQLNAQQKQKIKKEAAPKSTTQYIGYQKLFEDGICQVSPGYYSKTVRFSDINYQTARVQDQKDMFSRYVEALNFVDPTMPLQLTLVTRKVDEEAFRAQMFMPMAGDLLDKYRTEMNEMLASKIKEGQNSIVREKYFTYATEAEDLEDATSILARFETQFIGLFKSLGVDDMTSLTGEERINLLRSITRPDQRDYVSLDELARTGWNSRSFVAPTSLDFSHKYTFEFGNKYGQVLYFGNLPADLSDELLTALTDLPINMVISIHLRNISQVKALSMVDTKIAMMEMENTKRAQKGIQQGLPPEMMYLPETKRALVEARELSHDLRERQQRFFETTPLIFTYADTEEELAKNVFTIKQTAQAKTVTIENIDFMQREAFNSILPIGKNHFGAERTRHLTTVAAAIFVPFTTQELYQRNGTYCGLNSISHNLIMFNRLSLPSPNGFILGKPGSGKSFAAKREIINVLLNDPNADVLIIDPEREYTNLAQGFDGEVIHISADSNNHLNPMDISENYADDGDPIQLKSEFILSLCDLLSGGLQPGQNSIIDRVILHCYEKHFSRKNGTVPTLNDFYDILKEQPEELAQSLALSLELYIKGNLSVFAHHTNVDTHKRFIIYDIRDLGKQLRTLGMLIVLDQIWNRVTQNRAIGKHTYIYIDEIQLLVTNAYSSNYFFELWSRSRKWGAVPTGITQNVETLLLSDEARRMLSNCDYIMMLNQSANDRVPLAELLNISPRQLNYVTNAEPGSGLLFAGKSIIAFTDKFPKDTELYKMITTKLEEVVAQDPN
ncbi:VirB4-like conjugal transfer ATPase, CD1110 family [Intestinibacillus sp. Marseille-P6563]|uniref:VirB4-like conjugal transfer ATPase, CD1110 family n=1 Tax=Intestinibacillus sp. Marseille-P6563 TaxID=2364792 RepID=UPI000F046BB5